MKLVSYLVFNGQCEEAFKFYEKVLGGKIVTLLPHAGTPAENFVPPEWKEKIMHARMDIGDQSLMGSDAPPDRFKAPNGFSVSVHLNDVQDGERIFNALSEGGKIGMPFAPTFWAERFGMTVDRYGIPWMINCETPA